VLSRIAEALFWVGRYVERAEDTARLLDVHFHLVPRLPDQAGELRGPRIFAKLGVPPKQQVPPAERDRIAAALQRALGAARVAR